MVGVSSGRASWRHWALTSRGGWTGGGWEEEGSPGKSRMVWELLLPHTLEKD